MREEGGGRKEGGLVVGVRVFEVVVVGMVVLVVGVRVLGVMLVGVRVLVVGVMVFEVVVVAMLVLVVGVRFLGVVLVGVNSPCLFFLPQKGSGRELLCNNREKCCCEL